MSSLVAIGFAEALAAPEVLWSLVDAGFDVIAFSRKGRRPALRKSRHVSVYEITAPEVDAAKADHELFAFLSSATTSRAGSSVLLPLDDASLWLGSRMRLPDGWIFAGPTGEQAALALDKRKQIEAALTAGFHVPETSVAENVGDLARYASRLPVILRPAKAVNERSGRLAKGSNWICSDSAELERVGEIWRGNGPLLVQPYLQGVGEGVFGFATPRGIIGWSGHRRLRMMNPHGSGSSACISQPVPTDVQRPAERFVSGTNWRGLFMIELLRSHEGRYTFVEFNGRAWGSMALARRQGLEYPAWAAKLALAPTFVPDTSRLQTAEMECRNLGRELMHLLFVLRGPKSRAIRPWPKFHRAALDILRWRFGTSFYNWRKDESRVFWADTATTLRDQIAKPKS